MNTTTSKKRFSARKATQKIRGEKYKIVNLIYDNKVVGGISAQGCARFNKGNGEDMLFWGDGLSIEDCKSLIDALESGVELHEKNNQ